MSRPRRRQVERACLTGKHIHVDVYDDVTVEYDDDGVVVDGTIVACWCLWCGGASYDGFRIDDDGQPIGFEPTFEVRIEPGYHRLPEDARLPRDGS